MKQESGFYKFWRIVYPILIYFIIQFLVVFGFITITFALTTANAGEHPSLMKVMQEAMNEVIRQQFLMTVISAAVGLPIFGALYAADVKKRRSEGRLDTVKAVPAVKYVLPVILGLAACILGNNLITFSGLFQIDEAFEEVAQVLYQGNLIVEFLCIGVLVPIVEELLFRGLVYRRMRDHVRPLIAGILSALLFGIVHGNLVQGVYAFLLGALMAYVFERFQSILAPILIHVAANLFSVAASELPAFEPLMTEGTAAFWIVTAVCAAAVIGTMYLVEKTVDGGTPQQPRAEVPPVQPPVPPLNTV
ncbi:MAG: CPBP family intramembrane metalloprotease [Lachnospiraceae bacterium]|nr:CPBP family intramembrane metalloprotease [Lachnospiraceae bacterium]